MLEYKILGSVKKKGKRIYTVCELETGEKSYKRKKEIKKLIESNQISNGMYKNGKVYIVPDVADTLINLVVYLEGRSIIDFSVASENYRKKGKFYLKFYDAYGKDFTQDIYFIVFRYAYFGLDIDLEERRIVIDDLNSVNHILNLVNYISKDLFGDILFKQ